MVKQMKKLLSVVLSAMMVCLVGLAVAEEAQVAPITGTITEIREDGSYIVTELDSGNEVHVRVTDETIYDVEWTLGEGDVVIVSYDGTMTRSLPPQLNATAIRSFTLFGRVDEVDKDMNRLLVDTAEAGQVWITLPDNAADADYEGKLVKVYFSGIMALSFPGQTSALAISIVEEVTGAVTQIGDEVSEDGSSYFMIEWGEEGLRVNFDDHSKIIASFDEGETVVVYYNGIMTRSMPGQVYAMAIGMPRADGE